ncbi:NAD(P)-dependent oxidoreductase [Paenibacillus lupini]|uniref:NAD-dependent epimerase/dehydratase family protein n=1 Tax=Paenibacillus lupini TaxID=1450204 RepID=UPI00141DE86E|nr:NAD(P)-dependent oxidoreductase [Paenibacillus lupini]NIK22155.1 nucleoside-diphosphate-sugar epimerase [Paenibacillus lupini]
MKVAVTGGNGRIGSQVIVELLAFGHEAVCIDRELPVKRICPTKIVDLTKLGEVYGALRGMDAVIHLAGINAPGTYPDEVVFMNNTLSTYHVLDAAAGLGIRKAACASSESIYGYCYAEKRFDPRFLPVDESHPLLPQDSYGLSKIAGEQAASMIFHRTGMQIVNLRFGHVALPDEYDWLSTYTRAERFLWSHVDVRDAAAACRLAVEAEGLGCETMNIAADDTCSLLPNAELLHRYYPNVTDIKQDFSGHRAWTSNAKAKKLLGWAPVHNWRSGQLSGNEECK